MNYDYIYNYTRELIEGTGLYNINNPERLNENDEQIYLASEVETALPGKIFLLYAGVGTDPLKVEIQFTTELSTEEVTILDTVVYNHKNNIIP